MNLVCGIGVNRNIDGFGEEKKIVLGVYIKVIKYLVI